MDLFDQRLYINEVHDSWILPSSEDITDFITGLIVDYSVVPVEVAVVSLIYIDRIMLKCGITLSVYNWHLLVLSCVIVASKVLYDSPIWTIDFIEALPGLSLETINNLERSVLAILDYNLFVSKRMYDGYCLKLIHFTSW